MCFMKYQRLLAVFLAACLWSLSFGQQPDVVRITTNLMQVDAVVTDKNGKLITDLKPEELQLFENDRPQKVTHFSFVTAEATPSPTKAGDNKIPIKKPGAYQLRVALRDQASERVGSSSQFVEVPDMKKRRLELSGILLSATADDPENSAAVRYFHQRETVKYSFVIYNPHVDPATGHHSG